MLKPVQLPSGAFMANGGASFVPMTSSRAGDGSCVWAWTPGARVSTATDAKSRRMVRIRSCRPRSHNHGLNGSAALFASFGLFAPSNPTTMVSLFVRALAISAAFKVVPDMDTPFGGPVHTMGFPMRLSNDPMQHALDLIKR